jgi:hypothetical protein
MCHRAHVLSDAPCQTAIPACPDETGAAQAEVRFPAHLADSRDEGVEPAPHPGRGEMVEVVSRADDLAIADPEHEDAGQRERLPGVGHGSSIFELGDDHLGIGRLVNGDVGRAAMQGGACAGRLEVLSKLLTGA